MPHAYHHAGILTIPGKSKILIMLRCQGNIFDHALRCFLILLKLCYGSSRYCLRRLGPLILHIQIRPFKMDPQDLCPLVSAFCHSRYVGNRFRQYIRHLCNGSWKNGGNSLFRDPSHPFPQSFRFSVIGIISIGSVGMDINKPRYDSVITIILVCGHLPVVKNLLDPSIFHL